MKHKLIVSVAILAASITLTGCLTRSPQVTQNPTTGQTETQQVYAPSAQIEQWHSNALTLAPLAQGLLSATPAAPAAPFVPNAIDAAFGLATVISGGLAAYLNSKKNTAQAAADQHQAAAASLAAGVNQVIQQQPGLATALQATIQQAARENDVVGTVAQHLANANSLT